MIERRLESAPLLPPAAAFTAGIAAAAWLPLPAPRLLAAATGILLVAALASRRRPRAALILVLAGVTLLGALRRLRVAAARRSPGPRAARRDGGPRGAARRGAGPLDAGSHAAPARRGRPARRVPSGGPPRAASSSPSTASSRSRSARASAWSWTPGSIGPSASGIPAASTIRPICGARASSWSATRGRTGSPPLTPDAPPWPVRGEALGGRRHRRAPARDLGRAAGRPAPRRADRAAARDRRGASGAPASTTSSRSRASTWRSWPASVFGVLAMCRRPARGAAGAAGGRARRLRPRRRRPALGAARHRDGAAPARRPAARPRVPAPERARARGARRSSLWRPGDLWEPGFQLSFAATAGIVYLAPAITALRSWRAAAPAWLAAAVAVSVGAQAAVTPRHARPLQPALADRRGRQPPRGAARRGGHHPRHARAAGRAGLERRSPRCSSTRSGWSCSALRAVVWLAAALPAAMVHLPAPAAATAVAWYGALLLAPGMAASPADPRRGGRAWRSLVAALSIWPWLRPGDGQLRVTFLDVGQGDAVLVELPEGPRLARGRRARRRPALRRGRARAGAVPLEPRRSPGSTRWRSRTADADHSGGLAAVLTPLPRGRVLGERPLGPGGARRRWPRCERSRAPPPRARRRSAPLARPRR